MAIKNIDELAKFVKGGADVLQKALTTNEEISLEFNEGSFVSDSDLETLKTNQFELGKKEGHTIGYDFAMKDFKKDAGLEIEGKDRKLILDALQKKIIADAKIEPDKKIQELNTSLENLRSQYNADLGAKDSEITNLNGKLRTIKIDSDLSVRVPDGLNGLNTNQFMMLAKSEFNFDYDDSGNLVAKKGDSILKDKMEKPIPVNEILNDFAIQNNWITKNGRGGGNEQGRNGSSEFKSLNDVYKHMETNKINPMSSEGQKLIDEFNNSKN